MRRRLLRSLALGSLIPMLGLAQDIKISRHTLANGMTVLVHEDHAVPNVAMYFFYRIGSRNERPGTTGLSHYFEHMMFNGAKKYGPKQFDVEMEKAGGSNNAYTTSDVTVYTDWFPKTALDLMFDMEADRIRDLAFDPKIIESERGVVFSERRLRVDNSPSGVLNEQLRAAAFIAHPYHWPVVGWPSDIEGWTMEDLKAHFRMGYAPNNCVMVVSGDVTEAEILAKSKQYLEPIPRQDPPPRVRTKEPEQIGERRLTLRRPAQMPMVAIAWHGVAASEADAPVLDLLSAVLSQGRSSRLHRRLVEEKQLALGVFSNSEDGFDPGLFRVSMQVRAGIDPKTAEAEVYAVLKELSDAGVSAEDLTKARNQLISNMFRQLKTISGKANLLGTFEVFQGDANKVNQLAAVYDKITSADLQRVVAKYLTEKHRTVATLIPEAAAASKEAAR
jgi:zinc protease